MTKPRAPLSYARALARIADLIGWDGCAQVVGKSESFLRKLGDPDTATHISLQYARRLDDAYYRAGGEGAPFLESYTLQLQMRVSAPASAGDLLSACRTAAQHSQQALCATLATIENDGDVDMSLTALGTVEDAITSLKRLARKLHSGEPDQCI